MHLHRVSPQVFITKINLKIRFLYFCGLLFLVLLSKNPYFLSTVFIFHFVFFLSRDFKIKEVFHLYLEPLFVAILIVLIKSVDFSSLENTFISFKENSFLGLRVLTAFTLFIFFFVPLSFFETIKLMQWLRIPVLFQELLFLSFKFISLLKEDISLVYLSQKNRLGYSGIGRTINSLKYLAQASFFKAMGHSENTLQSMKQRGFDFSNLSFSIEPIKKIDIFLFSGILLLWILLWLIL